MVRRAPYFHAKSTAKMMVPIAFNGSNASNGALVVNLVDSFIAGDAPSPNHDGETNL